MQVRKWFIEKLGGVEQKLYDDLTIHRDRIHDELMSKRAKIFDLEREIKEKDKALHYLPMRFLREMGEETLDDGKMWMPPTAYAGVDISMRDVAGMDIPVFRADFGVKFSYQILLDGIDTVGYASAAMQKMAKQIARAVEEKLAADGLQKLSNYLQEKDATCR